MKRNGSILFALLWLVVRSARVGRLQDLGTIFYGIVKPEVQGDRHEVVNR